MTTYHLQSGRYIYKDGKPFVFVQTNSESFASPTDADAFAHLAAAAPDLLQVAQQFVEYSKGDGVTDREWQLLKEAAERAIAKSHDAFPRPEKKEVPPAWKDYLIHGKTVTVVRTLNDVRFSIWEAVTMVEAVEIQRACGYAPEAYGFETFRSAKSFDGRMLTKWQCNISSD